METYTIACKACKKTFWGKGTYCGECERAGKVNPFKIVIKKNSNEAKQQQMTHHK